MYVLPKDGADEHLDTNGAIAWSVAAMQKWLAEQTGGQQLRIDTHGGALDITFFRLPVDDEWLADLGDWDGREIGYHLAKNGFNKPGKVYAVYYGGSTKDTCGEGGFPYSPLDVFLFNPPPIGVMFLKGKSAKTGWKCDTYPLASSTQAGPREFLMLHEIVHGLGFVHACAPHNAHGAHVGDSPKDLMYTGPEAWQPQYLDFGNDDYYGHGRADCPDLANSPYLTPKAK